MKNFLLIPVLLLTVIFTSCSTETLDPGAMYSNESSAQIFSAGEKAMQDNDLTEAIYRFEAMDAQYPFSQYTQKTQLNLIYCYYENDDIPSALASSDRYIQLYPRDNHIDYAYYMRGLIKFDENRGSVEKFFGIDFANRDITVLKDAFFDFSYIARHYPHSPYAQDARQHMIYIRNTLAQHQLNIARYYFDRKAYVAAINRATDIVTHYQKSTAVEDALILMRDSYNELQLKDEAKKIDAIIKSNFG